MYESAISVQSDLEKVASDVPHQFVLVHLMAGQVLAFVSTASFVPVWLIHSSDPHIFRLK